MMKNSNDKIEREAYGTKDLSFVDRFGIWLSRKAILSAIKDRDKLDVLELGCGYFAKNLFAIEDRATHLVGIDFNLSEELDSHKKFEGIKASINQGMDELKERKFDLIMIISVLEHLENPVETLQKCFTLLKPGGKILINVPTWKGKIFLEFSAFKLGTSPKAEMDDHKMYYNKRDLWPLLVKAGYLPSNIKMQYHKFRLNLFAIASRE